MSFTWECLSISRQSFKDKNKLSRCRRIDLMMIANVEYIFFILFEFVFFETTMSSDATRFAVCFDFLTRLSSMILQKFNFDESMFLLRSRNSAMSRNVRSISDKSFNNERLSFIARLSRVDDDDEIIDANSNWDEEVVARIERNNWLEMMKTFFALINASIFSADELSSIENDETTDRLRMTIVSYFSSFSVKSTMYDTESKTFNFTNSIIFFSRIMFFLA
jgi:hypothetical protein